MWRAMRRFGPGRPSGPAPSAGRSMLAAAAALCVVATLPDMATARDATPTPYAYGDDVKDVGGVGTDDASADLLALGKTYRSSIGQQGGSQGGRHYRLQLNATDNVYVSVTAIPKFDSTIVSEDGIELSIWDSQGNSCGSEKAVFGEAESPRPITTAVSRMTNSSNSPCQGAGTYYLHVDRIGALDSAPDDWNLELHSVAEPAPRTSEPTTAPDAWDSSTPAPPAGEPEERHGGSGFTTARPLGKGAWKDRITPGETRFYRVPVGWGQQLFATAEVTGPAGSDSGTFTDPVLVMALYNPVRGLVDTENAAYQGKTASAVLPPLPPVAYENRYTTDPTVSGMRFGGSYYLALSINSQLIRGASGVYEVTLDLNLKGSSRPGPTYAGEANPPGTFTAPQQDEQATGGEQRSEDGTESDSSMLLLAVASYSVGGVLLLVLGLWVVLARRRAPRAAEAAPGGGQDGAGGGLDPGDAGRDFGAGYGDAPVYGAVPGYGAGATGARGTEDSGTTGTGTGQGAPGPFGSPGPW